MSFFDLDKHNLDVEWEGQPKLYWQSAEKLAGARAEYERAKTEKELVEAELSKEIRSNPAAFGLEKVTENAIKETMVITDRYKKAAGHLIEMMHNKDIYEAEIYTLDNRKKALENLVQLHLANYFSAPKVPDKAGERMKQVERDSGFRRNRKEF